MIKSILLVGVGGFLGTILRFLVSRLIQVHSPSVFPWATFIVNVTGCLLIGIIYGFAEKGNLMSPQWRLFLTVGICGGFTTFSTFSNEAYLLIQDREWLRVTLYASLSFFLGLVAIYAGRFLSKLF